MLSFTTFLLSDASLSAFYSDLIRTPPVQRTNALLLASCDALWGGERVVSSRGISPMGWLMCSYRVGMPGVI
ncbi:hypothetical protein F5B18DRAFT_598663 [Nemania serpens]|nr:hypothetical protein F5B18DRAFT_598663 [Nemania serpens]